MVLDHAAAILERAEHVGSASRLRRRRVFRPAQVFEARHEEPAAMGAGPREVMPCARLPEPPDRAFDLLRVADLPEFEPAHGVDLGFGVAARTGRRDGCHVVGIGFAARLNEAERVALPPNVGAHFVILVHDAESEGVGLERRRRPGEAKANADAGDDFEELLVALPAQHFVGQHGRLIEQARQPGLELVDHELSRRPYVQDWAGPLVKPSADHVEDVVGLAALSGRDGNDPPVAPLVHLPGERDHVARECRVAGARNSGGRRIAAVRRRPGVRRRQRRRC